MLSLSFSNQVKVNRAHSPERITRANREQIVYVCVCVRASDYLVV